MTMVMQPARQGVLLASSVYAPRNVMQNWGHLVRSVPRRCGPGRTRCFTSIAVVGVTVTVRRAAACGRHRKYCAD
jgi:hypothetical protein